ncbi:MAG: methyltransferase [Chloroflexota bacterium]
MSLSWNPIYVSLTAIEIGVGLALGSTAVFIILIPTLLLMRYGVIAREEAYMLRNFNEEYAAYKRAVRRWL